MRDIVLVGRMPWYETVATHNHEQLGLHDKCLVIKGFVVLVWLESMIYGMDFWTKGERCMGLVPCCGQDCYQAKGRLG